MGRPLNDPNHSLARLRKQLTPERCPEMTRKQLSEMTGIPEVSLKAIELGRYELRTDVAMRIAYATGVHPYSLIKNEDPLLDFTGERCTEHSIAKVENIATQDPYLEARQELYNAALEAALDKNRGMLLLYSFEQWLLETCKTLRLETGLAEKLTKRLGSFDSKFIHQPFRPRNRELAAEWKAFEEQVEQEETRLFKAGWGMEIELTDLKRYTNAQLFYFEQIRRNQCRAEAHRRIARQRDAARTAPKTQGSKSHSRARKAA